jgi:deoxycytidine triphosphate deaminase
MNVLARKELIELFKSNTLGIEDPGGVLNTWVDRDYSWDNPFQQCSIDLHVGFIYVPETEPSNIGGAYNPKTDEHVLMTGHTVMIRTKEKITMPNNVGGICFSPSRLSLKAVLVTNMGHVDPGYSGHLHFTAINMGKEPYAFRVNDIICSMIFFKLSESVLPYGKEHFTTIKNGKQDLHIPVVISNYFPKLARDFVDVEKRAQSIAKEEIDRTKFWQIGVPVIAAVIIAVASLSQLWINKPWEKELTHLGSRIESMEMKVDFERRIKELENELSKQQKLGTTSQRDNNRGNH